MTPGNPVVGGTVLRRAAIQSPNFTPSPLAGWAINADGTAYFADVTAEGTITASTFTGNAINGVTITGSTFDGTNFVINSAGAFFYSGTPAAGNLTASIASAAGTDGEGNNYVAGHASYGTTFAAALSAGFVVFYTGSLAGGWTPGAQVETDSGGDLILTAGGSGSIQLDSAVVFGGGGSTGTAQPAGVPTGGPNSGTFAGHTHDFDGHTHDL